MWDCAAGAESGTGNHQRGYYLLLGALLFVVLLYKAWGPLLLVTLALVVVVHTCYSLLVNDSLFAPHTLVLLGHARKIGWELAVTLRSLGLLGIRKVRQLRNYLGAHYDEWSRRQAVGTAANAVGDLDDDMNGRHRRTYSLSTTGNELMNQVSPIVKDPYRTYALNGASDIARTSTPLHRGTQWKKDVQPNGDLGLFTASSTPNIKKQSPTRSENRLPSPSQLRSDESLFGPKGSPWGANSSPKLRDRPLGMKTVQTVAGPLLASTRYNIDPKIYTDISSPGLTTRLTKYAAEASNKLTHQPQYAAGQFPKVNLNASPIPVLSPKVARARIPVTVRVAPPEIVNYSPVDTHQERPKMSPNSSPQELKESKSFPSVNKTLKKLPLKRHTSREDIMLDLAKKQRFERIYDGELENLEEMMQKRTREESIASDEDGSPQSKNERPLKRPKASSCHDVINSFSSSINVYTGVKRKAMDTSRCNTPSIEKHFKPSTTSPPLSSSLTPSSSGELTRSREQLNVKVPVISTIKESSPAEPKEKSPEVTKPDSPEKPKAPLPNALNLSTPKVRREVPNVPMAMKPPTKLTDKLFMRAEPQSNEKIKTMIEEQGRVEAKFTTDDKEEIKKEDIVNMRQNSMRLRLQSMFDAISGKSSKIDPDVVIQAEEVNPPASTPSYTSLSCATSTTTVNTSPITTTIVPILKTDADTNKSPPTNKHVTFNLPSSHTSFSSTSSTLSSVEPAKPAETKLPTSAPNFNFGSTSTSTAPSFNFGSNAPAVASTSAPTSTTTSSFSFPASSSAASVATSKVDLNVAKTTTSTSISSSLFAPKPAATSAAPTLGSTEFSFGATAAKPATTAPSSVSFGFPTSVAKTTETSLGGSVSTSTFGNPLAKSPPSTSLAQTTSLPSFGADKKDSTFSFGAASAAPSVGSTTNTSTSQPPSIFGSTTTSASSMFSSGSNANPPPPYTAPATTTSAPAAAAPMFNFGGANKQPGAFSFGGAVANPAATTAASTVTPTFGSGTATAATGFGAPAAGNPAATTSAPAFGTSTPSLFGGQTTSAPSLFSGATSSTTANPMFKSPSTTTTFGAPQPAATTVASTSIFGTQSGVPSFGATVATTSATGMFGNTAAATTSSTGMFGNTVAATTSSPGLFGNTAAATTSSTGMFGNTAAATTSSTGMFGNTAAVTTSSTGMFGNTAATTSSTGMFGNTAATAPSTGMFGNTAASAANTSLFGNATAATTTTPSAFGGTQPQSSIFAGANTSTTGTTSIFGATTAAAPSAGLFSGSNAVNPTPAANATDSGSIFGQAKPATSISFGGSTSAFSSAGPSSSFAAPNATSPSTFQLGAAPSTSASLPTFGAIKPTAQFGSPSVAQPAVTSPGSSIFGATPSGGSFGSNTAPPAFGANTNAASTFGASSSTSSAFGMPSTSASASAFGAASTSSFGSTTSPFGAAQPATTSTPSLFGNAAPAGTSTAGPSANSTFSFGGSQPAQPAASQPAGGSFSFGAAAAAPAGGGGSGVFQFGGASNASKPAGFNFNAPTAAPQINFTGNTAATPAFNAPAPNFQPPGSNMFSIGSGSSTPRSRTGRSRRQR